MSDISAVYSRYTGADLEFVDKATGNVVFALRASQVVDFSGGTGSFLPFPGNMQYAKVTLTAAQVKALHGTPITLVAAPGAGKFVQLLDAALYLNYGTAAFAAGSTVQLIMNSIAIATTTAALLNNGSSIMIQPAFPALATTASQGAANAALTITASGSEFTTGDSTVDVHLWYAVITA